jgi:hypothetical protein
VSAARPPGTGRRAKARGGERTYVRLGSRSCSSG